MNCPTTDRTGRFHVTILHDHHHTHRNTGDIQSCTHRS
jgi:hypothetical protein